MAGDLMELVGKLIPLCELSGPPFWPRQVLQNSDGFALPVRDVPDGGDGLTVLRVGTVREVQTRNIHAADD